MSRYLLFLYYFCLLVISPVSFLCAQDFPAIHYTVEDGLPSNTIYDIYRDSKGFLWIATDKGVARYNGIKFETFSTFNGLPDNEIFFFQEDRRGRIWLGTYNGELCYYQNDTFYTATNTPFLKLPVKTSFIKYITVEEDSTITIGFNEQNFFLNIDNNNKINTYYIKRRYSDSSLMYHPQSIKKVSKSLYDVLYCNGHSLRIDTNSKILLRTISDSGYTTDYQFCQDQRFYFSEKYLYSYDRKVLFRFAPDFFSKCRLYRTYVYDNRIYFCTSIGLFIDGQRQTLVHNKLSSITQDNTGNFWIGTLNEGIISISKNHLSEKILPHFYDTRTQFCKALKGHLFYSLSNNNLYTIVNDSSKCLFDFAAKIHKNISKDDQGGYFIDDDFNYYNFYFNHDIYIENILSKHPKINLYNDLYFSAIKNIFLVNKAIYYQIYRRVIKLDYSKFKVGDDLRGKEKVINDTTHIYRIFCLAKDESNNLWYNNINSMYKIVNDRGIPQHQFDGISFKLFDFIGKYMVGFTHNNQLLVCNNVNGVIQVDTVLSQNCIWEKIYKLDSSHILISTNGLYRVFTADPANSNKKFSISAIESPFVPLRAESICVDSTNCYFFKDGNVISMKISSLYTVSPSPKLFFTSIKAGKKTFTITNEVRIPFELSRNISISFSTISFGGKSVTYQYSVSKNGQNNWREIEGDQINLVNAGYGTYAVKIRAKTVSSDFCEPVVFSLHIGRPYWASWWFIMICVFCVLAVVALIVRIRIKSVLNRNKSLHDNEVKFMRSEYKALNALMNPHFIFNTLNNVQSLVNKNDKLAANEYLRIFADIIRQNMHNVSKELIPLQKEVDLVTNYLLLEKLRFKDLLNYRINIDESVDLFEISVPPLLVQPLVENSIKHGILPLQSVEGYVEVNIKEEDGVLIIEVRDNGVGIEHSKGKQNLLHESFGLDNIRKRIDQLSIIQNKKITFDFEDVNDREGRHLWTVITITMPISA